MSEAGGGGAPRDAARASEERVRGPATPAALPLRPLRAAALVLLLAASFAVAVVWRSEQGRLQLERARASDMAGDYAHALQFNIERALSATYSLAALVRQGKGAIADFDTTARELLPFYQGVASLQLAPGGVVRRIVPLAGNEGAIGHDLLKDPARTKEAFLARDTGKLTLAGPFKLVQGGIGAVGRLPVFLDEGAEHRSFWGFTIVLIRFPEVLEPARLASLEERGMRYELWRVHPDTGKRQVIAASSPAALIDPVDRTLELPNGTWTLSVAPSRGWGDRAGLAAKAALGLLLCLLLFALTHTLLATRARALELAGLLTSDLRASEERFRRLFEYSPVSIWEEDFSGVKRLLDGLRSAGVEDLEAHLRQHPELVQRCTEEALVLDVNRAAVVLHLAASKAELLAGLVQTFTPESFDTFRRELVAIWGGRTELVSTGVVRTLSGERRDVIVHFAVSPGHEGTLSRVLVSLVDVTAQRRAEAEIQELNQGLERRVAERTAELQAAKDELEGFAYSISHDLRAPLRHVDGFVNLLRDRVADGLDAQAQHYLSAIEGAARRMGMLVDDLLSFSRMGHWELAAQEVDLAAVVAEVVEELAPEAAGREVRWTVGALPRVTGDRAMLRLVFVNLLSNGLKFTRSRQRAEIEVGQRSGRAGETVLFVRDNGVGFDMRYAGKLFGVFQRLHRSEDFEGTGIGLANVHRIVMRHGGRTWAESEVDRGATFYFSLPRAPKA